MADREDRASGSNERSGEEAVRRNAKAVRSGGDAMVDDRPDGTAALSRGGKADTADRDRGAKRELRLEFRAGRRGRKRGALPGVQATGPGDRPAGQAPQWSCTGCRRNLIGLRALHRAARYRSKSGDRGPTAMSAPFCVADGTIAPQTRRWRQMGESHRGARLRAGDACFGRTRNRSTGTGQADKIRQDCCLFISNLCHFRYSGAESHR